MQLFPSVQRGCIKLLLGFWGNGKMGNPGDLSVMLDVIGYVATGHPLSRGEGKKSPTKLLCTLQRVVWFFAYFFAGTRECRFVEILLLYCLLESLRILQERMDFIRRLLPEGIIYCPSG